MKTYEEIKTELKLGNRSYVLADTLGEMPASGVWRSILNEVAQKLRELGDGEIHVEACFVMDKQRNPTDQDGDPSPGNVVLHKEAS